MPQTSGEPHVFDVIVIGFGPTGVTAANLLGAAGLSVVVLDRDPEIFPRARAVSCDEEVMRVWQRIGLAEQLKQDMLTDRPVEFVDARGRSILSAELPARGHGHPPQMFFYQPVLEQVLRDGVDRYPNVDVRLGHECVGLRQDTDAVEMSVRARSGQMYRLRAGYVVAADGGSSSTRSMLNIGYSGRTRAERWMVIDTKIVKPWPGCDRMRFHCDPAMPAVDCPTPFGHHRWEFPLPVGATGDTVSDEVVHRLVSRFGVGQDDIDILRAIVYDHHVRIADRWRDGRVFLTGDAAHAMPPWTGQGMAAGVRDAANLCWKIASVVRNELPQSILDSYEIERRPHVRKLTRRAVFVGRIITERRRWPAALRDVVLRTVDRWPGMAGRLQDANWIPPARHRAGLLANPRTRASGHLLPQAPVIVPDGTRMRLDDALPTGWLLLSTPGQAPPSNWEGFDRCTVTPAGSAPAAETVVDEEDRLLPWLKSKGVRCLALRPDGHVYAAAGAGHRLPDPPHPRRLETRLPHPAAGTWPQNCSGHLRSTVSSRPCRRR